MQPSCEVQKPSVVTVLILLGICKFMLLDSRIAFGGSYTSFAPLGKRQYLIEESKNLTVIQKAGVSPLGSGTIMLDPIQPNADKESRFSKSDVKKPLVEIPESIPAILKFKHKSILGRYAIPRIDFSVEELNIGQTERKYSINPIDSIFRTDRRIER